MVSRSASHDGSFQPAVRDDLPGRGTSRAPPQGQATMLRQPGSDRANELGKESDSHAIQAEYKAKQHFGENGDQPADVVLRPVPENIQLARKRPDRSEAATIS